MGWTSYPAMHYTKSGQVDRKAECDAYFEEGLNRGHYKVVKSAMHGSVYYGAVKPLLRYIGMSATGERLYEPLPEREQKVFAVVFLTSVDSKDAYNFSYKNMDESEGPCYYDCPKSVLDALSPTENIHALEWRKKCRENLAKERDGLSLSKLPVGSKIRFKLGDMVVELVKHPAAYQFKRPFWYDATINCYYSTKRIPETFEVVSIGAKR